jgi:hypothetical protein
MYEAGGMVDSPTMSSPPVAVIDALNSLLEAEQGSVFRFMGEGSPYLSRATAEVRRPLQMMVEANQRYVMALADMIQRLGGEPRPRPVRPEEQYLAFLSLKFLLPKLVDEKVLILQRYENVLRSLPADAPREVVDLLRRHQSECRAQLEQLKKASEDVIAASRASGGRATR